MTMKDHLTVVGVFADQETAQRAIHELHDVGFSEDEIGFAMRAVEPPDGTRDAGVGTKAGESAISGMVTGGVVGGVAAAAVSLLVPGIGPIIGGGILAAVLGGAAAGAATGGMVGAFVGLGVPEEEARYYNNEFEAGRALVTVRADSRYKEAAAIIERYAAPSQEEQERDRAFAANPISAAIAVSAATTGATAAGTRDYQPRPLSEMTDAPVTPDVAATEHMPMPADEQPPLDRGRDAAVTGPSGQWPVRADDGPARTHVADHASTKTRGTDDNLPSDGASTRTADAARGDGPYVDPAEDLERVGATSGMRPPASRPPSES